MVLDDCQLRALGPAQKPSFSGPILPPQQVQPDAQYEHERHQNEGDLLHVSLSDRAHVGGHTQVRGQNSCAHPAETHACVGCAEQRDQLQVVARDRHHADGRRGDGLAAEETA